MSNVFEEIYADAFRDELEKIANDNGIDPNQFVAGLEKVAASAGVLHTIGESYKNLLDAVKGLGSTASAKVQKMRFEKGAPERYALGQKIRQGKVDMGKIKKAKAALAITAGGLGAGGVGVHELTKK